MPEDNMTAEIPGQTPYDISVQKSEVTPTADPSDDVFPEDYQPNSNVFPSNGQGITDRIGSIENKWQRTIVTAHNSYVKIMKDRGATEEELVEAHKRFSGDLVNFHKAPPVNQEMIVQRAERELSLFLRAAFDSDISILRRFGNQPDIVANLEERFRKTGTSGRESILTGTALTSEVQKTLIPLFMRLLLIKKDLDPNSLDLEESQALFNGSSEEEQARIAKSLLSDIEKKIAKSTEEETETFREVLIDGGASSEDAVRESLFESDPAPFTPEDKLQRLHEIQERIGAMLVEQFDGNVQMWSKINGGREDVASAWQDEFGKADEKDKLKIARMLFTRIQRRLRVMGQEHLIRYEKILKEVGIDTPDIQRSVDMREIDLLNKPHSEQLEIINTYANL